MRDSISQRTIYRFERELTEINKEVQQEVYFARQTQEAFLARINILQQIVFPLQCFSVSSVLPPRNKKTNVYSVYYQCSHTLPQNPMCVGV